MISVYIYQSLVVIFVHRVAVERCDFRYMQIQMRQYLLPWPVKTVTTTSHSKRRFSLDFLNRNKFLHRTATKMIIRTLSEEKKGSSRGVPLERRRDTRVTGSFSRGSWESGHGT